MLDLNQHLGIGEEASAVVESLRQFSVKCQDTSVDIQLRLRRRSGAICHFRLLLDPLQKAIVPEDTVPKLRGKDTKRRLEVKLFKHDKQQKWYGDLVTDKKAKPAEGKEKTAAAAKGSILNPLTPEELAALPRPSDTQGDNRPSTFSQQAQNTDSSSNGTTSGAGRGKSGGGGAAAAASNGYASSPSHDVIPAWVSKVDRRQDDLEKLLLEIHISDSANEVSMKDMELNADAASHSLSLKLLRDDSGILTLAVPSGADVTNLEARWRRKTRVLEIRLPTLD